MYENVADSLFSVPPFCLGYPSDSAQSTYYPGHDIITLQEVTEISKILESHSIWPENTRIRKSSSETKIKYEVLQASVQTREPDRVFTITNSNAVIHLKGGDHYDELEKICDELEKAAAYARNDHQALSIKKYVQSFQTGNLDSYRDSLRDWVADKGPRVENIFGFVEPYRDPHGIRSEFEGLVGISDAEETKVLARLVQVSDQFIKQLPWAQDENGGKGPFEKSLFDSPDLSSIHSMLI